VSRREEDRAVVLERRAPHLVKQAAVAGTQIEYMGIAPIFFNHALAIRGPRSEFAVWPVGDEDDRYVPSQPLAALRRLHAAGVDFPLLYALHEGPIGSLPLKTDRGGPQVVNLEGARSAIGMAPPSTAQLASTRRLATASDHTLTVLRGFIAMLGAAALAPVAVGGLMIGALTGLDPVLFGVIPASNRPIEGTPGVWYALAQWTWN
jgi:hypothetical protein